MVNWPRARVGTLGTDLLAPGKFGAKSLVVWDSGKGRFLWRVQGGEETG